MKGDANDESLEQHSTMVETLRREIKELRAQNESYIQTISFLSNELLNVRDNIRKRHHDGSMSLCKKNEKKKKKSDDGASKSAFPITFNKLVPFAATPPSSRWLAAHSLSPMAVATSSPTLTRIDKLRPSISDCPPEMFYNVFRKLEREDLDRCQLVCKQWYNIIKNSADKWQKRTIVSVKLIEKSSLTLTIKTRRVTKKYAYTHADVQDRPELLFDTMKRFLPHSHIKRLIMCNVSLTDDFCSRLANCFKALNFPTISRVEMLALNLHHISPDVFHKFLGQTIVASQYFIDGVRNAVEDHFSSVLLEQPAMCNADDFTVYDVRSLDNEDVVLAIGDDVLLNHIFGATNGLRRNTLYLDSPDISVSFLASCLLRFVECENVDRVISHVEFAHCHEQQVPTLRNITLEYEHNIQVEWSATNARTGRVMEARVSRNGDDDDFCHLTLTVQSE